MDTFDKPPEIQVPTPGVERGTQREPAVALPPEIPPQAPPTVPPPNVTEPSSEGKKSYAWVYGSVVAVVGIIIVVVLINSDSGSGNSSSSTTYGGGPSAGGSAPASAPALPDFRTVCKALDEKNGFKDFRFGMTVAEARAVLEPTDVSHNPGANVDVFQYSGTAVNKIGEFATETVWLRFFDGHLYRVDVRLSGFATEIFEALKINYGAPTENRSWTRGQEKLTAMSWDGERVSGVILALPNQPWDAVVIYDQTANQKAREYADKEPERAAADFSTNGFKSLLMGMRPGELPSHTVLENDEATGVKKTVISRGDILSVGFYPLRNISCEFFQDRLYRIDFSFDANRKELLQTVERRFGPLEKNNTWTRGSAKLSGKTGGKYPVYCTILAPEAADGLEEWDFIVLVDNSIAREAEQFKAEAPKKASKDFSAGGFRSLTMGMLLQDLGMTYSTTENNEVTGVRKIVFRSGDLLSIGAYPLRLVSCEFFKDKLYRIDLEFNQNRQEIFQAFRERFAPLQVNDSWTQGTQKLTARSGGSERCYATILAPGGSYGGQEWETIVLLDGVLQREAAQYKEDAPKRAAKDL